MVNCAVPNCKNDSRKQNKKNNDITFHRFPKCQKLAKNWAIAIKRPDWEPNIRSFVCSIHFSSSSISESKSGMRKLVQGATPELQIKAEKYDNFEKVAPFKSPKLLVGEDMPEQSDTPQTIKLKRQIIDLKEIAKRRRSRCKALYQQRKRLRKKIASLEQIITQLREKDLVTENHKDVPKTNSSRDSSTTTNEQVFNIINKCL